MKYFTIYLLLYVGQDLEAIGGLDNYGDKYVDWCAYSFFSRGLDGQSMIDFARSHQKPVFIAEATPVFEADLLTLETDFDIPEQAEKAKKEWFPLLFKTIADNPDVVKAISYINVDWRIQPMWQTPPFNRCDSRIQQNEKLSAFWKKEIAKNKYLKLTDKLYETLWHN
ncbi:MAG: hypothetical protein ACERKD_13525 [Prolixibacteraceae bacterium]